MNEKLVKEKLAAIAACCRRHGEELEDVLGDMEAYAVLFPDEGMVKMRGHARAFIHLAKVMDRLILDMGDVPQPCLVEKKANPWACVFKRKPVVMDSVEVARTLGMKHSTFMSRWREAGVPIPHHVGSPGRGRKHYWRRDDVVAYLTFFSSQGQIPPIFPEWERRK